MHKGIFKTIGVILVAGILLAPTIGYVQGKDPVDTLKNYIERLNKVTKEIKELNQEIAVIQAEISAQSGDSSVPPIDEEAATPPTIRPPKPTRNIIIGPSNGVEEAIDKLREQLRDQDHEQPETPTTSTPPQVSQYHDFEKLNCPDYKKAEKGQFFCKWGTFTNPVNNKRYRIFYATLEKLVELSAGKVINVTVTQPSRCGPCVREIVGPNGDFNGGAKGPFITPKQAVAIGWRGNTVPAKIRVQVINGNLVIK
jgi:hypothetical protein